MQSYKGVHVRVRTGAFCSEAILRIQVVTIQCILAPVRTVRGGEGVGPYVRIYHRDALWVALLGSSTSPSCRASRPDPRGGEGAKSAAKEPTGTGDDTTTAMATNGAASMAQV